MIYLDPEIRYGDQFYEYAKSFRQIAIEVDENPCAITKHFHFPAIDFLLSDCVSTAVLRTQYLEALSYGDPGVLLACPGPSLSGLMIRELGLIRQKELFFLLLKEHKMRTFFALTELKKGSDASHIDTKLIRKNQKNYYLSGTKCFFGNGAVGDMGIVFAKTHENPLSIRAVWITSEILQNKNITRQLLPVYALKSASLSIMSFEEVCIPDENILGHHLPPSKHGLLGIIKVFNQLRTGVGAIALGQAQAVYDALYLHQSGSNKSQKSLFRRMFYELSLCREFLLHAAKEVDFDPLNGTLVSIAKIKAVKTAEQIIATCFDLFELEYLLSNPWIMKACRDMYCWDFMEGTSNILKTHVKNQIEKVVNNIKLKGMR